MTPTNKRRSLSMCVIAGLIALPACNLTIGGLSFGSKAEHDGSINTYYHAPKWHVPADAAPQDSEPLPESPKGEEDGYLSVGEGYLSVDDPEEFRDPPSRLWDE